MKAPFQTILCIVVAVLAAACDRPQKPRFADPESDAPAVQSLNYHALVIGIGDYAGTEWPNLGNARADAEAMGQVLKNRYGFNVIELTDAKASRGNILRTLDQLMHLTANDALLIYFAGHGFYDEKMDEGYWIPYGAQRSRRGQIAKEDWLWNSSIDRVVSASPAKHILLIADTCYGGSLFRGEHHSDKSGHWYRRAMDIPSRYLISSGNLEPVLDSGIRHSVFAQEILNYLQYGEQNVFSASDISVSIRAKVGQLTGQHVRMGPLQSAAHAGGEFVFVRNESASTATEHTGAEQAEPPVFRSHGLDEGIQQLASRIKTYSQDQATAFVRPRILACIGPTGSNPEETAMVRTRLFHQLDAIGGCILVEREAFDSLLHEIELSRSGRADSRAATEIGKLLPASLVLFGEIIPSGAGRQEIHLRIVDTETSRVLSSTFTEFSTTHELNTACNTLSLQIMETMNQARPLLLPTQSLDHETLRAGWGRFHGARIGDTFEIITRKAADTVSQKDLKLGIARLLSMDEESAEFQASWTTEEANPPTNLWLRATL